MNGTSVSQRIEYLSVIGGFLDGLHVRFGAGLNTIIGARGTGKTTVVECLAYALDTLPSSDHAPQERKRVETLIKRNLNGGRIEVGTHAVIERDFAEWPTSRKMTTGSAAGATAGLAVNFFLAA